jgi:D-alanyl-D-alanine endopeptidase (penicillin-binding protein 7)
MAIGETQTTIKYYVIRSTRLFLIRIIALLMFFVSAQASTPAAWVFDATENRVITGDHNNTTRPIASLTKLMTAMVVLNSTDRLEEPLLIIRKVSTTLPFSHYSRLELLNAMLVKSDNAAAETLAENYPGGRAAFLTAMNDQARDLGMINTSFEDPTGLSRNNISTPSEVGRMLLAANSYALIRSISTQTQTTVHVPRSRNLGLTNTNFNILSKFKDIAVSKTGFTNPAGFCLGLVVNRGYRDIVIVVLGEPNKKQRAATIDRIMRII